MPEPFQKQFNSVNLSIHDCSSMSRLLNFSVTETGMGVVFYGCFMLDMLFEELVIIRV